MHSKPQDTREGHLLLLVPHLLLLLRPPELISNAAASIAFKFARTGAAAQRRPRAAALPGPLHDRFNEATQGRSERRRYLRDCFARADGVVAQVYEEARGAARGNGVVALLQRQRERTGRHQLQGAVPQPDRPANPTGRGRRASVGEQAFQPGGEGREAGCVCHGAGGYWGEGLEGVSGGVCEKLLAAAAVSGEGK